LFLDKTATQGVQVELTVSKTMSCVNQLQGRREFIFCAKQVLTSYTYDTDYFKRVSPAHSTKFWINNVTREEARLAIEAGAVGCTQILPIPGRC